MASESEQTERRRSGICGCASGGVACPVVDRLDGKEPGLSNTDRLEEMDDGPDGGSLEEIDPECLEKVRPNVVCVNGIDYFIDLHRRQLVEVGKPQNVWHFYP